ERFFSSRVALVSGLMLALYAPAIFFDGLIQKSTLDVFLVCLTLCLVARLDERSTAEAAERAKNNNSLRSQRARRLTWTWLWLGLAIGALTLTRENAIVFTAVILVWIVADGVGARLVGRRFSAFAMLRRTRRSLGGGGQGRHRGPERPARQISQRAGIFLLGVAIVVL